ncbi:DsrE/DsrF/TusD sulfur relay family protein [Gorillibacterium massiliense]|uniref:DsrE/DsrF/TusD sulfur relay family protein n=1 Tax=Gorillibacterium massiliense TaxID=1280390 RepID=UPI0004BA8E6D|nr:DsrE family protein [Gorillibacterium massiliense]
MKLGIILETKEPEKAWNAFRFANTSLKRQHEVKLFLMGEAVECESINAPKYNVVDELKKYSDLNGVLYACGTCLKSRMLDEQTSCPISTMNDCVEIVEWADKVITF